MNQIDYPLVDKVQTLVVTSQPALFRYVNDLLPGGRLLVDPHMIRKIPECNNMTILRIPATTTPDALGRRIVANMVMLGALQAITRVVSEESLLASIRENVPSDTVELNIKAVREGIRMLMNGA